MLRYLERKRATKPEVYNAKHPIDLKDVVWIDLIAPTKQEEQLIEKHLNLNIPTREEMVEIEVSSRLYHENNADFMTMNIIAQSMTPVPVLDPVTFVLTKQQLITVRYIEPQAFKIFDKRAEKLHTHHRDPIFILMELLETNVDRLADILELIGRQLEDYSKSIFKKDAQEKNDYHKLMQQIGAIADLNTKVRESLVTFSRLIAFFSQSDGMRLNKEKHLHVTSIHSDLTSLSDHANFLSTKITFLLEATLGMVNIEQNNIIKILSVAAVIFLPPTLIASVYGMNFQMMPELAWKYGYFLTVGLIVLSAWVPYRYFKYRKWL